MKASEHVQSAALDAGMLTARLQRLARELNALTVVLQELAKTLKDQEES